MRRANARAGAGDGDDGLEPNDGAGSQSGEVVSERRLFHDIAVRAKQQRTAGYCAVLLALDEHIQQAHHAASAPAPHAVDDGQAPPTGKAAGCGGRGAA